MHKTSHKRLHKISIHAAREGGDDSAAYLIGRLDISIHAAREGGDLTGFCRKAKPHISIHAAREGGDHAHKLPLINAVKFQSTPPVKAATV